MCVLGALLLASCGENKAQKQAEEMLEKAGTCYEQGQYNEALTVIDSLRKLFPNTIDTRKKARKLYQNIELKKAQLELATTDSLLQAVNHDYVYQQEKVERDKAALRATPEELTMLTLTRMKRDSLRTQSEVLGAKIRYINKKQRDEVTMDQFEKTNKEFEQAIAECRALFEKKLHDYKASWRILRPTALTDQLFIKAKRIRSLEIKQESLVGEGIRPEFIALINYGIVGLIQLNKGFADIVDISNDEAMRLYDQYAHEALELMKRKNHDYDEAWRSMRVSSYTDFILTKIERIKEIENLGGDTLVSEGIDANYMDIINYAVFGMIKLA